MRENMINYGVGRDFGKIPMPCQMSPHPDLFSNTEGNTKWMNDRIQQYVDYLSTLEYSLLKSQMEA
jgi:hypothetical protein